MRWRHLLMLASLTLQLDARVLNETVILEYLGAQNRHIALLERDNAIAREKASAAEGAFDVALSGKYEEKDYPKSRAEYREVAFSKRLESGAAIEAIYRSAEGTQEYNNIKTGEEGEYLIGISLPLLQLYQGTNPQHYQLYDSRLQAEASVFSTTDQLRLFYYDVLQQYYTMLMYEGRMELHAQLFERAKEREDFIGRKVIEGQFAPIMLEEAKAMSAEYHQKLMQAQQELTTGRLRLCYLLDIECQVLEGYELPVLPEPFQLEMGHETAMETALQRRTDLKVIETEQAQVRLASTFNEASRLPKSSLGFYSLYDPLYEEGYKVTFEVEIPLQQSSYEARSREYLQQSAKLREEKMLKTAQISNELQQLYLRFDNTRHQHALVNEQCERYKAVVEAARKRFALGSATLMELNQQEVRLLLSRERELQIRLALQLIVQAVEMQTGRLPAELGQ